MVSGSGATLLVWRVTQITISTDTSEKQLWFLKEGRHVANLTGNPTVRPRPYHCSGDRPYRQRGRFLNGIISRMIIPEEEEETKTAGGRLDGRLLKPSVDFVSPSISLSLSLSTRRRRRLSRARYRRRLRRRQREIQAHHPCLTYFMMLH